jgi:hypothetical protein
MVALLFVKKDQDIMTILPWMKWSQGYGLCYKKSVVEFDRLQIEAQCVPKVGESTIHMNHFSPKKMMYNKTISTQ